MHFVKFAAVLAVAILAVGCSSGRPLTAEEMQPYHYPPDSHSSSARAPQDFIRRITPTTAEQDFAETMSPRLGRIELLAGITPGRSDRVLFALGPSGRIASWRSDGTNAIADCYECDLSLVPHHYDRSLTERARAEAKLLFFQHMVELTIEMLRLQVPDADPNSTPQFNAGEFSKAMHNANARFNEGSLQFKKDMLDAVRGEDPVDAVAFLRWAQSGEIQKNYETMMARTSIRD